MSQQHQSVQTIFKFNVGDPVVKVSSKINGCCGSSLLDSYTIKSVGIYTDTFGRKIPLYELDCIEFFTEDQLEKVG